MEREARRKRKKTENEARRKKGKQEEEERRRKEKREEEERRQKMKQEKEDKRQKEQDRLEIVLYSIKVEFQGNIINIREKFKEKTNIREEIQQVRTETEEKIKSKNTLTSGGPVS